MMLWGRVQQKWTSDKKEIIFDEDAIQKMLLEVYEDNDVPDMKTFLKSLLKQVKR